VKAGVRGRIAEVLVDEGIMVKKAQTLFMVEPDTGVL